MITVLSSILEAENLEHLLTSFTDQGVTDSILSDLSDSDLKDLGIDKLGERRRLLAAFKGGASTGAAAPAVSAAAAVDPELEPPAAPAAATTPAEATKENPFVNSLGMPVVPIPRFDARFGIWPVRVQDYEAYCVATGVEFPSCGFHQDSDHPMVNVSWDDAIGFCVWLTVKERAEGKIGDRAVYRLPTDLEWSAAVGLPHEPEATPERRNRKVTGYLWGLSWPPPKDAGNFAQDLGVDSFEHTSPVGSFRANAFGLYDMGGNVGEWCMDWNNSGQYLRVLRGASWGINRPEDLLSSNRYGGVPDLRSDNYGFRIVLVDVHPYAAEPAEPAGTPTAATPAEATKERPFVNSLAMQFVPVPRFDTRFCIWPVRVQDYKAYCMASGVEFPSCGFHQHSDHPMVNVSWDDARGFCAWLTKKERAEGKIDGSTEYRLPTDLEWSAAAGLPHEKEARPDKRSRKVSGYPWGLNWPPPKEAGNFAQDLGVDSFEHTSPVESFRENAFGLYDMGGNVWEWCMDWNNDGKYSRVLRGASWGINTPEDLLSSNRYGSGPSLRRDTYGFRIVLAEANPVTAEPAEPAGSPTAATPAKATKQRPFVNSLDMQFVPIPRFDARFCIWPTRVRDFEAFCVSNGKEIPLSLCSFQQDSDHPIVNVPWHVAIEFCVWLTWKERAAGKIDGSTEYRLPTDLEWSAAAGLPHEKEAIPLFREESKSTPGYPWGKNWPPPIGAGNYSQSLGVDSFEYTSPVGSFPANTFGLYDMGGNVWEWCESQMDQTHEHCPSAAMVLRGASWSDADPRELKSSGRIAGMSFHESLRDNYFQQQENWGFRCVLVRGSSLDWRVSELQNQKC